MPCASCGGNKKRQQSSQQAKLMGNGVIPRQSGQQTKPVIPKKKPVRQVRQVRQVFQNPNRNSKMIFGTIRR